MTPFNPFRIAADLCHIASRVLLIHTIHHRQSAEGLSLKTQVLYFIVFVTRYVDLFWNWSILYNIFFKIIYILTTALTCYMIGIKYKGTYKDYQDRFNYLYLIIPAFVLCTIFNNNHKRPFEYMYSFSLFLESVAILPQLVLLQEQESVENITGNYIFMLGFYRVLYIMNWIWRLATEQGYRAWIQWTCGIVQSLLYADFFYLYLKARANGKKLVLPG